MNVKGVDLADTSFGPLDTPDFYDILVKPLRFKVLR